MIPNGNTNVNVKSSKELGDYIRRVRKAVGMTQRELAGAAGVGVRFIIELENGKPTCEIGRALYVLSMLGIKVDVNAPSSVFAGEESQQ